MPVEILCCYARKDQSLLNELKTHLIPLEQEGLMTIWADTDIDAGVEWEREVAKHLNMAEIILLLISKDFINSEYCHSIEMRRAIERHERGEAYVIPIILRPVSWQGMLGKLQAVPKDGKPIMSRYWRSRDEAFSDITQSIRKTITTLNSTTKTLTPEEGKNIRKNSFEAISVETSPTSILALSNAEPLLYVKEGKEPGRTYEINRSLSIGRNIGCNIFIEDFIVSRQHALVFIENNRNYFLKDNNSTNGTIVNGKMLERDAIHALRNGDTIQIGQTVLVFRTG